jgi:zinc protease
MKRLISLLIILCISLASFAEASQKANPRSMTFSDFRFDIPKAERVLLDCGMPVYLLHDPELPIINITAMVHTGSVYESESTSGLASITGIVMRSGGAGGLAAEIMDDELEFMASSVESSIGSDIGTVSMSTLSRNLNRTLQIFSDVLLRPDFNEKRVEIARKQMIEGLRRQNDDPKEIAQRELIRVIYAGHPLGVTPSFKSAAAIKRGDIIDFHRRFFRFDNMIMAIAGDFDRNALIAELNSVFRKPSAALPAALPEIPQPSQIFSQEILYGRKDINQTVIRLGHLGISKDSPDIFALRILNYILGGSFTSRLTLEIRTNQGLAYNVGSSFDIGRRFIGTFIAETETKVESTLKTINPMRDIIADMTKEPVTDSELKAAKEYIINSFIFGFTSPASIAAQRARLDFFGYPDGYLEKYRDNISRVTKDDVLAAAKKYLRPEALKLVVVGDSQKFDKPLSILGDVRELDLKQTVP